MKIQVPFVLVCKEKHYYLVSYGNGGSEEPEELVRLIVKWARDERLNFGFPEVRVIMKQLGLLKETKRRQKPR